VGEINWEAHAKHLDARLASAYAALSEIGRNFKCSPCSVCDGEHHWIATSVESYVMRGEHISSHHPVVIAGVEGHYECMHCEAWTIELWDDEEE